MGKDLDILNENEISSRLNDFPGWNYKNNKISKEFKFRDFMDCLSFIVKISSIFEINDHHPDIHIYYSKIVFELQRFDIGGKVTNLDFKIAKIIEDSYNEYKKMLD
ncbi:4a-hydroxytetrahydrobiopterin dehydratase [Candidatus Pacearchaeota archaeon]|nr:4a-hydroxytetrahydrobiopterin dehydratase [Candidatus Pacearchaeota archaeon]